MPTNLQTNTKEPIMNKQASLPRILDIRIYGDEVLRRVAEPVTDFDDELKHFAEDLIHTMYERDGVGLAAPQVGVSRRMFSFDPNSDSEEEHPIVVINPEIKSYSGEISGEEGCISIPDIFADVTRHKDISVSYQDIDGNTVESELSGYAAIVFQHEFDHLNGVLFTDKISNLAKLRFKRRLRDMAGLAKDGVNIRVYDEN